MTKAEDVNRAIAVHADWKGRLRAAIDSGVLGVPLATVRDDRACELGRWLSTLSRSGTKMHRAEFQAADELHAHFHNVAGQVAELAVGGNKADAKQVWAHEFEIASQLLTTALLAWREKIDAGEEGTR